MGNRRVTEATHAADGTKTFSQLDREMAEVTDAWATVTECLFCDWTFTGTAAAGREAAAFHRSREHANGKTARQLLDAMDAGESVAAETGPAEEGQPHAAAQPVAAAGTDGGRHVGGASKPHGNSHSSYWTKERVLEAIHAFAKEHGHPPTQRDFNERSDCPSQGVVVRLFGSWADGIVEAGFERPTRGGRATPERRARKTSAAKPARVDPPPGDTNGRRRARADHPVAAVARRAAERGACGPGARRGRAQVRSGGERIAPDHHRRPHTRGAREMTALFAGMRFPRSMLAGPANERLLEYLGVEIVDDCTAELEDYARAWLATMPAIKDWSPSTVAVRQALERIEERKAAA